MPPARIADHVGRVLGGRYRLLAPIGTGASAHVFLADDVTLRRRVAVKILHAALADDEAFLRRFRAEAQAAAALNHPNIMRVFDWGEDDDGPYLVLEYLGGGSLRDLLDRGRRLTPSQAAIVGLEAARALDYAHRRGLVHRDIKPANLLFDDEGRLCIADFGLARALAEAAWTEPTGAILGTARYASPEQASGASVDGKADVYALAVVLVEAVTGQVPFAADTTVATLMARTERPLPAPEELGPLGEVITGAGTVTPEERADSAALVAALDRAVVDLPAPGPLPLAGASPLDASRAVDRDPTALPPTRPRLFDREKVADPDVDTGDEIEPIVFEPSRKARRKRRWIVPLAIVIGLLVLAGGAYATYEAVRPEYDVPKLTTLTVAQARSAVADEEFDLEVTTRHSETVEKGRIMTQDPAAGTRLRQGGNIAVVVSDGPPPRDVPDLAGLSREAAEALLKNEGFAAEFTERYDEQVERGRVLEWAPTGRQEKGTTVTVTLSQGPAPRPVPAVAGKTYDEAATILKNAGFAPARAEVFHETVPVGQVVGTTPGTGTRVDVGGRVTVNVSKGPELIPLPDVRGKSVADATAILERAGFVVDGVEGNPNRPVTNTSPAPGTPVKRGAHVGLYTR